MTKEKLYNIVNTLHILVYITIVVVTLAMLVFTCFWSKPSEAAIMPNWTIPHLQPLGISWHSTPKQVETIMGKAGYQYTSNSIPKQIPQYLILKFTKNQEIWIFQFNQERKLLSYSLVRIQASRELAAYAWDMAVLLITHTVGLVPVNILREGVVGMAAWNMEPNKLIMVFANATEDTGSATLAIAVSRLDI